MDESNIEGTNKYNPVSKELVEESFPETSFQPPRTRQTSSLDIFNYPDCHPVLEFVVNHRALYPLPKHPIIIGRERIPEENLDHKTVYLQVPHESVSMIHCRIEPAGAFLLVTDLDSTNGTTIIKRSGESETIPPGEGRVFAEGDKLLIGVVACQLTLKRSIASKRRQQRKKRQNTISD